MIATHLPKLDDIDLPETRDALHSYAKILGDWLKSCRQKRKHWWHASLRPSLTGLTTGVVHANIDFRIDLNMRESLLLAETSAGERLEEPLRGQSAAELGSRIESFLVAAGIHDRFVPDAAQHSSNEPSGYSAEHAFNIALALNGVTVAMQSLRAGIREETSPIQVWPHHFDLSMLWLPGEKIPGQDPGNEEYSDKQMNFGFVFGDEAFTEPYFYVTAYPLPDELPKQRLPDGTTWQSDGFSGAVLLYRTLIEHDDPARYLLDLWDILLTAGREHMLVHRAEVGQ